MAKRKSVILPSDSSSDDDVIITQVTKKPKPDLSTKKVSKRKSSDGEEEEEKPTKKASGGRQPKVVDAFKQVTDAGKQKTSGKRPAATAQKNTLDNYFCKKSSNTEISSEQPVPAKKSVSAVDYFTTMSSTKPTVVSVSSPSVVQLKVPEPVVKTLPKQPSPSKIEKPQAASLPVKSVASESKETPLSTPPVVRKRNSSGTKEVEPIEKSVVHETPVSTSSRVRNGSPSGTQEVQSSEKSIVTPKSSSVTTPHRKSTQKPVTSSHSSPNENISPHHRGSETPKTPLINEDKVEMLKKRHDNYLAFKTREGPQALGSRVVPKGSATCLKGLTLVVTGVLECVDRDELKRQIENMGGKVTGSVSKRTSYLVVGRDPGASKISKAAELKVKQVDEDGLFNLLEERAGHSSHTSFDLLSSPSDNVLEESSDMALALAAEAVERTQTNETVSVNSSDVCKSDLSVQLTSRPLVTSSSSTSNKKPSPLNKSASTEAKKAPVKVGSAAAKLQAAADSIVAQASNHSELLWVDKYRPRTLNQLVGQFGAKSCANKLLTWLKDWHRHLSSGAKAKAYNPASGWNAGSDEGVWARAALLSGPPGIGKTTTVEVVCQTLGFTAVELNASDQRNKRSLKENVAQSLHSHSLTQLLKADFSGSAGSFNGSSPIMGKNHCLVMDEVDGMAGNEDRGGMQELLQLIKTTQIPIICMCNDRQSTKVRSLANYCLDLRFQRPRVEQIKGLLLSIASKEKLNLPHEALNDIIIASNQDIRQVVNNLQMWKATSLTSEKLKKDAADAQKDLHFSPFEVVRKVFLPEQNATIHDKVDLFFQDYNFGPLFVQENYLNVRPLAAQDNMSKNVLLMSRTADAIAIGDVVSRRVRNGSNWGLLPIQALFSSILPGEYYRGPLTAQINFPSWFGKNSTQNKIIRFSTQLCSHMRLSSHGSCQPRALFLDYAPILARKLTLPLREGDVSAVLSCLEDYDLLKDDMDALLEITTWPNTPDRMAGVDSKVKAALTRAYNKSTKLLPYAIAGGATSRARAAQGDAEPEFSEEMETGIDGEGLPAVVVEEEEEENGLSPEEILKKDAMIVSKKAGKKNEQPSNKAPSKPIKKKAEKPPAKKPSAKKK